MRALVRPRTGEVTPDVAPPASSTDAVRIEYGYPSHELFDASQRGEISLGGCVIGPESPDYECRGSGNAIPWVAPDD